MKLGKEIKFNLLKNYKTKIGTVNNKDSKSIYINITGWGEINDHDLEINYESYLNNLRKKIKQNLNKKINKDIFHIDRYIVDLDMRTSGFNKDKRSFMSCEITLYQKQFLPITQNIIFENSKDIISTIVDECLDKNIHFTFHKTKK